MSNRAEQFLSVAALKRAVRAAGCVGIMREDLLQEDVRRREFNFLRLSDKALTAQNYFCYAPQTPLSPVAERFVSLLRAARDNKSQIGGRLPGALISFQPGSSSESTGIARRKQVGESRRLLSRGFPSVPKTP